MKMLGESRHPKVMIFSVDHARFSGAIRSGDMRKALAILDGAVEALN